MVVGILGKQIILISTHAEANSQTEEMSVNVFLECREYFKLYIKKFKELKFFFDAGSIYFLWTENSMWRKINNFANIFKKYVSSSFQLWNL